MAGTLTIDGDDASDGAAAAAVDIRALYEAHFAFLWRSLRRLGVEERALDDALQQVFIVAARKSSTLRPETARAFLLAVAVRVASDSRRSVRRRRETSDDSAADRAIAAAPGPDEMLERREKRALLDDALDELPMDLRTVFVLFELEELSTPQLAEMLGIPLGTATSRLRRAREAFMVHARRIAEERSR